MRAILLVAIISALLLSGVSCGGNSGSRTSSLKSRALVVGSPDGGFYDYLASSLFTGESFGGLEKVSDYDLLVVDSDMMSDPTTDALIEGALTAYVPVVLLGENEEELNAISLRHLGIASSGELYGLLLHSDAKAARGRRQSLAFTKPTAAELATNEHGYEEGATSYQIVSPSETIYSVVEVGKFAAYETELRKIIGSENPVQELPFIAKELGYSTDTPPDDITFLEKGTIKVWTNTVPVCAAKPSQIEREKLSRSPHSYDLTMSISAYMFYDPIFEQFKVFLNQQGTSSIGTPDDAALGGTCATSSLQIGIPWYVIQVGLTSTITSSNGGAIITDSSPKNVNNQKEVTDSTSTMIGVSVGENPSAGASRTVTHSVTEDISDWSIRNESTARVATFQYSQTDVKGNPSYNSAPPLSSAGLPYSMTTLWSFPRDTKVAQFSITPQRSFYETCLDSKCRGTDVASGSFKVPLDTFTVTFALPPIPPGF
jgi:hypothetical protein